MDIIFFMGILTGIPLGIYGYRFYKYMENRPDPDRINVDAKSRRHEWAKEGHDLKLPRLY